MYFLIQNLRKATLSLRCLPQPIKVSRRMESLSASFNSYFRGAFRLMGPFSSEKSSEAQQVFFSVNVPQLALVSDLAFMHKH